MDNASVDILLRDGTLLDLCDTPWRCADAVIRDRRVTVVRVIAAARQG